MEEQDATDPIEGVVSAITDAVTEVVTQAVTDAMTRYVDGRLDWVMREVQDQILDFEHRVGAAMTQMAEVMSQRIVVALEQERAETTVAKNYERWVLTEAARLNVGVPEFAKVLAAVKAAEPVEKPTAGQKDG